MTVWRTSRYKLASVSSLGHGIGTASREHSSGDLILAFATGNRDLGAGGSDPPRRELPVTMLSDAYITPLFDAVIDATEEAIVNALLAAETMEGHMGTAHALPGDLLVAALTSSKG